MLFACREWNNANRHAQGSPDDQGLPPVGEPLSTAHELMLPPPDAGCGTLSPLVDVRKMESIAMAADMCRRQVLGMQAAGFWKPDAAGACSHPPALPAPAGLLTLRWRQEAAAPVPPRRMLTQRVAPAAAPGPPLTPPAPGVSHTSRDVHCVCMYFFCYGTEQLLQTPIMPGCQPR